MDHIYTGLYKAFVALPDLTEQTDSPLQILHALFDFPVSPQLFTDLLDGALPTFREHIILNKLTGTVGHPKSDSTLFHSHQTLCIHGT